MTPAEIYRAIESKRKVMRIEAQEKASYDYILAGLIVKGISIVLGSKEEYPTLENAYPKLFDDVIDAVKEEQEQKKTMLSVLRFEQFARSYNSNFKDKGGAEADNE